MRLSISARRSRASVEVMSVSMKPGATALTRSPRGAHSFESDLASCATPPLDAAYAAALIPPKNENCEASRPIAPPSGILRAAAWQSANTEVRLTSRTRRHSSSASSSAGPRTIVPWFATSASSRSTCSTARAACAGSPRSNPVARSAVTTSKPSARSRAATAAPIPRLAPVTSAVLALDMAGAAVRAENEVEPAVRHVVERHRRQRLHEGHAAGRAQRGPQPAVEDDHVPGAQRARLVLDRHLDLAVDDEHDLFRGVMPVPGHLLARVVLHPAEQHLLAADCVQVHTVDELERLGAVPGAERPLRLSHRSRETPPRRSTRPSSPRDARRS